MIDRFLRTFTGFIRWSVDSIIPKSVGPSSSISMDSDASNKVYAPRKPKMSKNEKQLSPAATAAITGKMDVVLSKETDFDKVLKTLEDAQKIVKRGSIDDDLPKNLKTDSKTEKK